MTFVASAADPHQKPPEWLIFATFNIFNTTTSRCGIDKDMSTPMAAGRQRLTVQTRYGSSLFLYYYLLYCCHPSVRKRFICRSCSMQSLFPSSSYASNSPLNVLNIQVCTQFYSHHPHREPTRRQLVSSAQHTQLILVQLSRHC